MTLVAAAVCPHPPLLVPDVAVGAAAETAALRTACLEAVESLRTARPDLVILVGAAQETGPRPGGQTGSFGGFGVPLEIALGRASDGAPVGRLPLSLTVGAWLLREAGMAGAHRGFGVAVTTTSTAAAAAGVTLAGQRERVALLVLGDGSARRSDKAPGALDERAEGFDLAVSAALATADCDALLDLDADLASELMAVGRAPWQVLAGAAWGVPWRSQVTYDEAPYGVGYIVATWQRDIE